jgi:hypothetical protein
MKKTKYKIIIRKVIYMKLIPIYSVQVYIVDITSNNYTTVIREIIRQLKAFSTVKTNLSVILVLMKLKISLNTFC